MSNSSTPQSTPKKIQVSAPIPGFRPLTLDSWYKLTTPERTAAMKERESRSASGPSNSLQKPNNSVCRFVSNPVQMPKESYSDSLSTNSDFSDIEEDDDDLTQVNSIEKDQKPIKDQDVNVFLSKIELQKTKRGRQIESKLYTQKMKSRFSQSFFILLVLVLLFSVLSSHSWNDWREQAILAFKEPQSILKNLQNYIQNRINVFSNLISNEWINIKNSALGLKEFINDTNIESFKKDVLRFYVSCSDNFKENLEYLKNNPEDVHDRIVQFFKDSFEFILSFNFKHVFYQIKDVVLGVYDDLLWLINIIYSRFLEKGLNNTITILEPILEVLIQSFKNFSFHLEEWLAMSEFYIKELKPNQLLQVCYSQAKFYFSEFVDDFKYLFQTMTNSREYIQIQNFVLDLFEIIKPFMESILAQFKSISLLFENQFLQFIQMIDESGIKTQYWKFIESFYDINDTFIAFAITFGILVSVIGFYVGLA